MKLPLFFLHKSQISLFKKSWVVFWSQNRGYNVFESMVGHKSYGNQEAAWAKNCVGTDQAGCTAPDRTRFISQDKAAHTTYLRSKPLKQGSCTSHTYIHTHLRIMT